MKSKEYKHQSRAGKHLPGASGGTDQPPTKKFRISGSFAVMRNALKESMQSLSSLFFSISEQIN